MYTHSTVLPSASPQKTETTIICPGCVESWNLLFLSMGEVIFVISTQQLSLECQSMRWTGHVAYVEEKYSICIAGTTETSKTGAMQPGTPYFHPRRYVTAPKRPRLDAPSARKRCV
jgi:hypothetical protein